MGALSTLRQSLISHVGSGSNLQKAVFPGNLGDVCFGERCKIVHVISTAYIQVYLGKFYLFLKLNNIFHHVPQF